MNIGFDDTTAVPTVDFRYPDEGDEPAPVVRDQWREAPLLTKCQQRFATVHSGGVMTMPLLDKRLEVLRYALREAVETMNVATILRLAAKARATEQRIAAEQLAADTPGTRERHGDIVIEDSPERGRVIVQFHARPDLRERRLMKMCGFFGGDDGTYWRRRTFRRGENIALDHARYCVERILEARAQIDAAQTAAA
ncbi:MAG: hypothetical protein ABMA13_20190 [Chthoniobacteraceae bacterium]